VLGLYRLTECDPESVDVPNGELPRAVERIVRLFDNFHAALDVPILIIDVLNMQVQVDLPPLICASFPTGIKHYFGIAKRQRRPIGFAVLFVVPECFEADGCVPIHGRTDIRDMKHWNDSWWHGSPDALRKEELRSLVRFLNQDLALRHGAVSTPA